MVDLGGGDGVRQRPELVHLQGDDALKVAGGLLAHPGHIQRTHLIDRMGALSAHMNREEGEHAHAQQNDPDQASQQKPCRFVLHSPAASWKARMASVVFL